MSEDDPIDWNSADIEMAKLIHSQAEIHLQAQLASALASDQRATTFTSIIASMSAAVLAGCVALWDVADNASLTGGFVVSACLLLAAGFGAWAARPIDFFIPGARPEQLYACRENSVSVTLGHLAENYQDDIDQNERFMEGNQTALRVGLVLALASPIVGILAWLCAN